MAHYAVYLEMGADGRCLAHVLDLPGCVVRAPARAEALEGLPEAIRAHWAWLRRHGEDAPPAGEPAEIEVAEEQAGGPFDPGDAAALFAPDRGPVSGEEMERYFRLMGHARADLLALVRDLPDAVLDWPSTHTGAGLEQPSFTLRRLLRHVGNAEEWYVSRLVSPETLPPEWEGDEQLPLFDFLEMERRTALARLRQLDEAQRCEVSYPTAWTEHPEEAWTARKALRRAVEHERQHTAQARRILAAYRRHCLARLAAERAGLLAQALYLDEGTLTGEIVRGEWTVRDILAHIAAWDAWEQRAMRAMVEGEEPDFSALDDFDATNAAFLAARQDLSLEQVLNELQPARGAWVAWMEGLPLEEFTRARSYGGYDWTFASVPLRVQWEHDAHHAGRIAAWRDRARHEDKSGSKVFLRAALAAAREELLTAAALVPPADRSTRLVCGRWTLKDVLGHVADWEAFGTEGLRLMAAGQPPLVEAVTDIDAWNQVHATARAAQSWEQVWGDFQAACRALVEVLDRMGEGDLGQLYPFPWGPRGTPYQWVEVFVEHDRSHARGLRGEKREAPL